MINKILTAIILIILGSMVGMGAVMLLKIDITNFPIVEKIKMFQKEQFGSGPQSEYQAIFLANGQVYFGRLSNRNNQYPVLEDVFYLKVTQKNTKESTQSAQKSQSELNLVKMGTELHGPTDRLMLNKEQILFVEDLKPDSKIVQAIKKYKRDQEKTENTSPLTK